MHTVRVDIALVLALIAAPAIAQAQQSPNTPPPQVGEDTGSSTLANGGRVDFGFRGTLFGDNSDEARYQRYRDLRTGPFVEGFRYGRQSDRILAEVRATHVGYRDQQYVLNYNNYGKVKASFEWNQIPLWFSEDTRTNFVESSPGVLRLGDLPRLVQTGASTAIYNAQATPFDLRLKRSIADLRLTYSATEHLDFSVSLKNTLKNGQQPWAGTFGFGDAVELPAPVDTRTTDFGVAAEWTAARGSVRLGYDSSMFRNSVQTLVWDNPQRATDSAALGPAQGRMLLWPDSDLHAGSVSGVLKLPVNSQATAYVSIGGWSQDQTLMPFTTNSALRNAPTTLDRPTADASARVTATAFSLNSRPVGHLWLNARFRSYDFDNRTPILHVPTTVSYDTKVAPFAEGGTSPYSFNRKVVDLDASWTPITYAAFRAAYSHETVDQTFRTFDTTAENTIRLSADATGIQWLTLRAVYEHAKRTGSGLDEQALDDIGEQVSLRQFDISDRNSDRVSAIAIVTPRSALSFNATAFVGREDRPGTVFGLRGNDNTGVGVGIDYVPGDAVSAGLSYQFEKFTANQMSRQANPGPQFNDPTRDWTTDSDDRAHTIAASADLLKLGTKTDVRFAYDLSRAVSTYVYGLAANTTLPAVAQLPPVRNTRNRVTIDGRYRLTGRVSIGLVYWFEKYDVDDFAVNPATLTTIAQPSFVMLGYLYRPYTASTVWFRTTYMW